MVTIELACRNSGQIRLLTEDELRPRTEVNRGGQTFRWRVKVNRRLTLGIVPDRVFALDFALNAERRERAFFFLEADRGTMPVMRRDLSQTSFYRKLVAYEATWLQSLHSTRFAFHRFRVLTITTSRERIKTLVNACSRLRQGHGLFLFVDKASLAQPSDVFSPIWQTGTRDKATTLLA
jgi:hypothetical protein